MKLKRLLSALCTGTLMVLLSGCAFHSTAKGGDGQDGSNSESSNGMPSAMVAQNAAITVNNDFALDLYRQFIKEGNEGNLFFSPYSVSIVLCMATEGARGKTAEEMGKVLCYPQAAQRTTKSFPWQTSIVNAGFKEITEMLPRRNDQEAVTIRKELQELSAQLKTVEEAIRKTKQSTNWSLIGGMLEEKSQLIQQINTLTTKIDQFELSSANALWVEKTYPIEDAYSKTINIYYGSGGIRTADFRGNAESERESINEWVEAKTFDKVMDMIPAGRINEQTRLVLVNAIYFKGEWRVPFDSRRTMDANFILSDGGSANARFMHAPYLAVGRYGAFNADGSFFKTPTKIARSVDKNGPVCYPGKDGFAIAELPYKGGEVSMVLIAPRSHDGLGGVEKKLASENLTMWLGKLQSRAMHVTLPRFKLETSYELKDTLSSMGMTRAFSEPRNEDGADFSGISAADHLYINTIIHRSFLEVDEKGTEAVAATAILSSVMASLGGEQPEMIDFTPEFKADRPFLLVIRHNQSGVILFMGRVMNPGDDVGSPAF